MPLSHLFTWLVFVLLILPTLLLGQGAGTLDPAFGQAGKVVISDPAQHYYLGTTIVMPDGKLMVAGSFSDVGGNRLSTLTRLLPDGSVDPTYGQNGHLQLSLSDVYIRKIGLSTDNKLILVGNIHGNPNSVAFVARVDANGDLDASFGQGGQAMFNLSDQDDIFFSLLIKPDGRIVLGGSSYDADNLAPDLLLVQLLPDGTPDPAFGTNGVVTADSAEVLSLALQTDGKIVTVGTRHVTFNSVDLEVVRFQANGAIDISFANNGVFLFGMPDRIEVGHEVGIQDDQKILIYGIGRTNNTTADENMLFRLDANGNYDNSFGTNGKVFTNTGRLQFSQACMVLQPNGKILVGFSNNDPGVTKSRFIVMRYNNTGAVDLTFGNNGKVQSPIYENPGGSLELFLQPDGKIIHTITPSPDSKIILWRYLNDYVVGVQETSADNFHLQCFPNPTTADFTIERKEQGFRKITVTDMLGRSIYNVKLNKATQKYTVPTTNWPAGLYIVHVDSQTITLMVQQ